MAESNALGQDDDDGSDILFCDEQIVIRSTDVRTDQGAFVLRDTTRFERRSRKLFGVFGGPPAIYLKRPVYLIQGDMGVSREMDRDVAIYSSPNNANIRAVLDALAKAPTVRRAQEQARRNAERATREAARAEEERLYDALVQRAAAKEPMPFGTWASSQSSGYLLTSTADYLAVHLDEAYGGPAIVDRFFERGLKHIIYSDIGSTRIQRWFEVEQIVESRSEARGKIAKKRNELQAIEHEAKWKWGEEGLKRSIASCRQSIEQWRMEGCNVLHRQYLLAIELRLPRLARQYEEMLWSFPGK